MTKKKLTWRLAERPTTMEIESLLESGIISIDEARDILFKEEEDKSRDIESLESEIHFLRKLIDKLSTNQTKTIEIIRTVQVPYAQQPWWKPYEIWCGSSGTGTANGIGSLTNSANTTAANHSMTTSALGSGGLQYSPFSSIKTF